MLYLAFSFVPLTYTSAALPKAPSNFIQEQNRLIGPSSDGLAEHVPDAGHVMKNYSNALYDIRKKDPSFSGKDLLENTRVKAFVVDTRTALNEYKTRIGNDTSTVWLAWLAATLARDISAKPRNYRRGND